MKNDTEAAPPTEEIQQAQVIAVKPAKAVSKAASSDEFSAEALISQGIASGMPIETMERLLAMRRELKAEKAKEEYDRDMALLQSKMPQIKKTKEAKDNGRFLYKYAPLDSIVAQTKGLIAKYGFSYATKTETLDQKVKVTVVVKHKLGHSEEYSVEVPLGTKTGIMSASQVVASALTFAKRYAFCNAFGILTSDEDMDASPAIMGQADQSAVDRQQTRSTGKSPTSPHSAPPAAQNNAQKRRIVGKWAANEERVGDLYVKNLRPGKTGSGKPYVMLDTNAGDVSAFEPYLNSFTAGETYRTTIKATEFQNMLLLNIVEVAGLARNFPPPSADEAPQQPPAAPGETKKPAQADDFDDEEMDRIVEQSMKAS